MKIHSTFKKPKTKILIKLGYEMKTFYSCFEMIGFSFFLPNVLPGIILRKSTKNSTNV